MNLERLGRGNKVRVAVGVVVLLAVVGGAYLAFADRTVEISNAEELQQVRENPSGNYVLVDDIDLSHIDNFEPIGDFTGTFDGNGHTISNLTIDRPDENHVGLFSTVNEDTRFFGLVDDEGTIENVTLKDANVTADENVGGLVGINRGTIIESSVEGNVSAIKRVGGLIGINRNTVLESHAGVRVTGDEWVGGLIGISNIETNTGGIVAKSYATGDVLGGDIGRNGGLIAVNSGQVRNSYAMGDVIGGGGGLVGFNVFSSKIRSSYAIGNVTGRGGGLVAGNDGEISASYAAGRVTGENTGGLVGRLDEFDGEVKNSYWDINSTGQTSSDGGVGLTTEEMTGSSARENMEGLDFGKTWETVTNPDDYPRLDWQTDG